MRRGTRTLLMFVGGMALGAWLRDSYVRRNSSLDMTNMPWQRGAAPPLRSVRTPHPEEAVKIEQETVSEAMPTTDEIGRSARVMNIPHWTDDETITQRVRTKLGEDPRTAMMPRLNVHTENGVCTIHGHVNSEREYQQIEEIARSAEDIKDVKMHVSIGSRPMAV